MNHKIFQYLSYNYHGMLLQLFMKMQIWFDWVIVCHGPWKPIFYFLISFNNIKLIQLFWRENLDFLLCFNVMEKPYWKKMPLIDKTSFFSQHTKVKRVFLLHYLYAHGAQYNILRKKEKKKHGCWCFDACNIYFLQCFHRFVQRF